MNEELPLPEPAFSGWDYGSLPAVQRDGYTADQMREYAKKALAQPERTGWPAGLLQDDDRKLSKWLASKPDAKHVVDMAQPEQDSRRLQIAMRQWEDWKTYALELQKKLVKYEGGSPMILNTQPQEKNT